LDFLARHRERFLRHPRLAQQVRNLDRLSDKGLAAIAARVDELRQTLGRV
jgi:deoxyribodipyrimidine photolyase-related protein